MKTAAKFLERVDSGSLTYHESLQARLQQPFWPTDPIHLVLLVSSLAVALVLRSVRVMSLFPVLVDEAIYLRWAEVIQHQHTWFISLLDAKPPISYWIYAALRSVFSQNPLLGNRLVSVMAGTLCVLILYRIGYLCAGEKAGTITASLYAVLPFGVLYDRLAYVDSLVNLCGAGLVYLTLSAFGGERVTWRQACFTGLLMGVSLSVKTTVLLFAPAPLTIGLWLHWKDSRKLLPKLASIYAIAAIFIVWLHFCIPRGQAIAVNNILVHHTNFFTPLPTLLHHPFYNLAVNVPLLVSYGAFYLGYLTLAGIVMASIALVACRCYLPLIMLLTCAIPLGLVMSGLEYFPSRYVFPVVWPLLLLIGCGAAMTSGSLRASRLVSLALAIVLAGLLFKSIRLLCVPERALHGTDAEEFLGSGPYSGSGVLPAIAMLRIEARSGPITILTDPWWGPPTDTIFAYLNEVGGTKVYEAWWLQLDGKYPLVPDGPMPMWKSQYQRIADAEVDFSIRSRLYYVTDTNYHSPDSVRASCPFARLIGRFPKRGGQEFVDVYRLDR